MYFINKYCDNPLQFRPYKKINGKSERCRDVDISQYPLTIDARTVAQYPNTSIKINKHECSFVRTVRSSIGGDDEYMAHAIWNCDVVDDCAFNREAKKAIRNTCYERKCYVNISLVKGCNHFLVLNKFKLCSSGFVNGSDDVYRFEYYVSNISLPIDIPNELIVSFLADREYGVGLQFDNHASSTVTAKHKDLYAYVTCNLTVKPWTDGEVDDEGGGGIHHQQRREEDDISTV